MNLPIRIRPISNILGILLFLIGVLLVICLGASYYYNDGQKMAFQLSSAITLASALGLYLIKRKDDATISKREGYLIVTLGWIFMTLFGMLPYVFSGLFESTFDTLFETMSGMTTTGATIITDIEEMPKSILLWRSMTQWIGGMGIIVLTVAIFPLLGMGGIELFIAEAPGPTSDKIHPRISESAKRLWGIYVGLTILLGFILFIEGMTIYDAINHALTTMATGGFSTKNASIAYYTSPAIQYTIILFMIFAGTNYTILYFGLLGKLKKVWNSEEFRMYLLTILIATIFIFIPVFLRNPEIESSFRASLFQIVSIITTTGFITEDYTSWGNGATLFCFVLLFSGACAGSTSGGIKIVRHLALLKNSALEFKRLLHPRALIRVKINDEIVAPRIMTHIMVFLLLYLGLFVIGTIIVTSCGLDFVTAMGAVATSLANVGPAVGDVGPVNNFAQLPNFVKLVLSILMLLGRLELFTVLVICTPYFWRHN